MGVDGEYALLVERVWFLKGENKWGPTEALFNIFSGPAPLGRWCQPSSIEKKKKNEK